MSQESIVNHGKKESLRAKPKQTIVWLYTLILLVLVIAPGSELVKQAYAGNMAMPRSGSSTFVTDFVFFYVAGKLALSRDRFDCYNPQVQKPLFLQVIGQNATVPTSNLSVHITPLAFPLMAPFALLSPNNAEIVWILFSLSVAAVGGFLLSRSATQFNKVGAWIWLLWVLSSFSSWQSLLTGQFSFLELGLTELFMWALLTNHENSAGIFLALTTLKPHYAIFLLAPTLTKKRVLISFTLCELTLLAVAACFLGVQNIITYPEIATKMDSTMQGNIANMACLRGLLSYLPLDQHATLYINLAFLVIAFFATVFFWLKMKNASVHVQLWMLVISIFTALLFSPHTFFYDYVLIAPAALLLPTWNFLELPLKQSPLLCLWSVILLFYPILSWVFIVSPTLCAMIPVASTAMLTALIACGFKLSIARSKNQPISLFA